MKPRLLSLGDSALLVHFGDDVDPAINQRVQVLETLLRLRPLAGVVEAVPAYASLVVHYDPLILTEAQVSDWIGARLTESESVDARTRRLLEVPVRYGGEAGPDLLFVATHHGLSLREVAQIHAGREYTVFMMGFTPGFPYMGKLEAGIATPRLETPRTHVAAGSVGIAGAQTGIYPIESPGGWRIIGRTPLRLFSPETEAPFLFTPGDRVRFVIEALDA